MFINFEGVDGSGKTSVINAITTYLKNQGYNLEVTREPGGTHISEQIRQILLNPNNTDMLPITEAYLYASARAQHVYEKIIPALKNNKIVITDRFIHSSLAYQGRVKKLGIVSVYDLNLDAIDGGRVFPDITFILDVPTEIALKRIAADPSRKADRFDQESIEFHKRVREAFKEVYYQFDDSSRWQCILIDASKSLEEVVKEILDILLPILKADKITNSVLSK